MGQNTHITPFRAQYTEYARQLLSDLGLGSLEEPLRGKLLASIEKYVSLVITNTLLENLDDTAIEGIDRLLERDAREEEVTAYLVASIPGIEMKLTTALETAYKRMLEESQQLTQEVMKHYRDASNTDNG